MPETIAAPAPVAASSPAPAASPAPASPAPVSSPAAASPAPAAAAQPTVGVDPNKFQGRGSFDRKAFTEAVLTEELAGVADAPAEVAEAVAPVEEVVADPAVAPEVPAPDAEVKPVEPVAEEPEFQLEPEAIVTPESLTQMVTDNPEFGKLLEADSRLKGQLYKTAREAAELQPYREIFPDLQSAKEAASGATAFNDVREVFMGSSTKEGTVATLGKIAELSYERDADGNVLMQNGQPVIGDDFYGFVDNVVRIDLENRASEVEERLTANQYHRAPGIETQEQAQAAYDRDLRRLTVLKEEIGEIEAEEPSEPLPENLRRKSEEISQREAALKEKEHGSKVQGRQEFERGLQTEAKTRLETSISGIFKSLEKQGAIISPYLKEILPAQIASKVIKAIAANPGLTSQMVRLQKMEAGDDAKQRRISAIDRAYQQYLPDIAREELRKAGIQAAANSAAKQARVNGQIDKTKQTEIRGSTAPAGTTRAPMSTEQAFATAEAEWKKANPGRRFDDSARNSTLTRVVQLQLQ
jgi:hypothetical protein